MESLAVIRALGALAQEHRLAVFRMLVEAGPNGIPAGQLAERAGLAPSSMSFHLAQLVTAGLAKQMRQGRSIFYAADYLTMQGLIGFLTDNCCGEDAAACFGGTPS